MSINENNQSEIIEHLTNALSGAVKEMRRQKLRADQTHQDLLDIHDQLITLEMYADSERVSEFAGKLAAKGPEIQKYI